MQLSKEQSIFIKRALERNNILVDACIGSGKTTAIQYLCNAFPNHLRILYLTYNKLLKIDAQSKIKKWNVTVTNYHGFAFSQLKSVGRKAGISDLIQAYNKVKPPMQRYDVLIIDEYQDIEQELAEMLEHIKLCNPGIQIIAVGDMMQKIYDKTTLNVEKFIQEFLGEHILLEFTYCFRLSSDIASRLGLIWKKKINGVNSNCIVEEMDKDSVIKFLSQQNPADILCLGARTGSMADTLNTLENEYPDIFNKRTVFASIQERDSSGATVPSPATAIFTTYDSSKGLERPICAVFDYTESYWKVRVNKPQQSYEILRNIFCVAASRGKYRIIFVTTGEEQLSIQTLSEKPSMNMVLEDVDISEMFDFKYKENIEECYSKLSIRQIETGSDSSIIDINEKDELIDLSPCIGIYQEAMFFSNYDIDSRLNFMFLTHPDQAYLKKKGIYNLSLEEKILFLVSLETKHRRYQTQVSKKLVTDAECGRLIERLSTVFERGENVQVECILPFYVNSATQTGFSAHGLADVVKDDVVYELKYVSQLSHENFLQCASYIVALKLEKGILWNTRDNTMYEITIPDKKTFLDAVARAITKNYVQEYIVSKKKSVQSSSADESDDILESIIVDDIRISVNDRIVHVNRGEGIIRKIKYSGNCPLILVEHTKHTGEFNTYDIRTSLQYGFIELT